MSVDTETRTMALIDSLIATPNGYTVIDESLNEDLRHQGSGPFISVGFDIFSDSQLGLKVGEKAYMEEGTVVFEIYSEAGTGTRELSIIRDQIRDAMRDLKVSATGSEEGTIYYSEISQQPIFTSPREDSRLSWRVLRVFLTYKKSYDV